MNQSDFWNNRKESQKTINELNGLENTLKETKKLKEEIEFNLSIIEDEEGFQIAQEECQNIQRQLENLEIKILLKGDYDNNDAILEIHSGAGGTEACDWVQMLYRMYSRYCERHNYKIDVIYEVEGTEAGIKNISVIIKGHNAYGYLKSEKGIHRLVRISPFDSNKRRHTSFAAVEVTPVIDDTVELVIPDKDIRIDVYRSSGAGGQGVNTTDSAVRVTHLPTGIIVTCQNERSQIQNKEKCMQILKSKLYEIEIKKKEEEMQKLKGTQKEINFGSQIRSYVMCPYTLVKDHRTNTEEVNVNKVLDGDLDKFIKEYLKVM